MVVNWDAQNRVALWFGVTRVNGVLPEQRRPNCLTCPGHDCGEDFEARESVSTSTVFGAGSFCVQGGCRSHNVVTPACPWIAMG